MSEKRVLTQSDADFKLNFSSRSQCAYTPICSDCASSARFDDGYRVLCRACGCWYCRKCFDGEVKLLCKSRCVPDKEITPPYYFPFIILDPS